MISKSVRLSLVLPALIAFTLPAALVSAQTTGQPTSKTTTKTTTTTTSTGTATPQTITGTDPTPIKWPPSVR